MNNAFHSKDIDELFFFALAIVNAIDSNNDAGSETASTAEEKTVFVSYVLFCVLCFIPFYRANRVDGQ